MVPLQELPLEQNSPDLLLSGFITLRTEVSGVLQAGKHRVSGNAGGVAQEEPQPSAGRRAKGTTASTPNSRGLSRKHEGELITAGRSGQELFLHSARLPEVNNFTLLLTIL